MSCDASSLIVNGTALKDWMGSPVPKPLYTLITAAQLQFTDVLQEGIAVLPGIAPPAGFLLLLLALFIACVCQLTQSSARNCCRNKLYSVRQIASFGFTTAVLATALVFVGSFSLVVSNEAKREIKSTLCRTEQLLGLMGGGLPGLDHVAAQINLRDVNRSVQQFKNGYRNLVTVLQIPFQPSSSIYYPNLAPLNLYYSTFCAPFTILHPDNGSAVSASPYAAKCALIKQELQDWQTLLDSISAFSTLLGAGMPLNSLNINSVFTYVNAIVSGSYIVGYNSASVFDQLARQLALVSSQMDLALVLGFIVPNTVLVFAAFFTLFFLFVPFLLYDHRFSSFMYCVWLTAFLASLVSAAFTLLIFSASMVSAQTAAMVADLQANPTGYDFSAFNMPPNLQACFSDPTRLFFTVPLTGITSLHLDFKKFVDTFRKFSTLKLDIKNTAKELLAELEFLSAYPEYLNNTNARTTLDSVNACSEANGTTLTEAQCTGPNFVFRLNPAQCYEYIPATSATFAGRTCIQIETYSPGCVECFPNPLYTGGQTFSTILTAVDATYVLDICDNCEAVINSSPNNLLSFGSSYVIQVMSQIYNLRIFVNTFEYQYFQVRKILNQQWRAAVREMAALFGQISYGLDCNASVMKVKAIESEFRVLAGQLFLAGLVIGGNAILGALLTYLAFAMTSRLKIYYEKQGISFEPVQEPPPPRAEINWEVLINKEKKEKVLNQAYSKAKTSRLSQQKEQEGVSQKKPPLLMTSASPSPTVPPTALPPGTPIPSRDLPEEEHSYRIQLTGPDE